MYTFVVVSNNGSYGLSMAINFWIMVINGCEWLINGYEWLKNGYWLLAMVIDNHQEALQP